MKNQAQAQANDTADQTEAADDTATLEVMPIPAPVGRLLSAMGDKFAQAAAMSAVHQNVTLFAVFDHGRLDVAATTANVTGWLRACNNAMAEVGEAATTTAPAQPLTPAVPIRKSVNPDYIVCLEDGKKLKMLKRHLKAAYNLTPEEYRAKWGLPADYPMVAPNYSTQRASLAKAIGLGKRGAA